MIRASSTYAPTMFVLVACLSAAAHGEVCTAPRAVTNFDTDLDGWTCTHASECSFQMSGGNPGGFIQHDDGNGSGGPEQIIAPSKFLGDWSRLNGGAISFDHKLLHVGGGSAGKRPYEVQISGPGDSAVWTGPTLTGETPWVGLTVPLNEAAWSVTGSWSNLLTSVTALRIRIETVDNDASPDRDINGIDNVVLCPGVVVPTLSTGGMVAMTLLFAFAMGVGVVRRGRKPPLRP